MQDTKIQWLILHAIQRLLAIPFMLLEIVIKCVTLGLSSVSPSLWWSERCLIYCVKLKRKRRRHGGKGV